MFFDIVEYRNTLVNTLNHLPIDVIEMILEFSYVYLKCDNCGDSIKRKCDDKKACVWEFSIDNGRAKNLCKKCFSPLYIN